MTQPLHILTGEYPPQPGGVGDYTRLVAEGLVDRGMDVHVWVMGAEGRVDELNATGPTIHRERNLSRIGKGLDRFPKARRILVQYAPNAFSSKGLNFRLGPLLMNRKSRGDQVRLMFHEVTYMLQPGDRMTRRLLVVGQRRIARGLLRAADAVDVAIPYWDDLLRPCDPIPSRIYNDRPVPSNIPIHSDSKGVDAIRLAWSARGVSTVVGSFGTFASDVDSLLASLVLPVLKERPTLGMILIGRGGEQSAERWVRTHPELDGRVVATGACGAGDISRHLQSADVLVQPYPGGVCGKRGSLMAGIAHGRPTLTTSGLVTEPLWGRSEAVVLSDEAGFAQAQPLLEALLDDPEARTRVGRAGRALYDSQFDVRYTLEALSCPKPWTS